MPPGNNLAISDNIWQYLAKMNSSFSFFSLGKGQVLVGNGKKTFFSREDRFPCFYSPGFFLQSKTPFYVHERMEIVSHAFFENDQEKNNQKCSWQLSSLEPFKAAFLEVKEGRLQKVVPYLKESRRERPSRFELFQMALSAIRHEAAHPSTRAFGSFDEHAGFIGCTPELLVKKAGNQVFSMACAGTLPKDECELLLKDDKLLAEHQFVVQGIHEGFAPFGAVTLSKTKAVPFKSLSHLVTEVQLDLKKRAPFHELVLNIHPTPALGAYPKDLGLKWLEQYDRIVPRGEFGAPFGVLLSPEKAEAYIMIRKAAWNVSEFYLIAGCGVVKESLVDKEIEEVKLKLKAIREILSL